MSFTPPFTPSFTPPFTPSPASSLSSQIKAAAQHLGFDLVRILPAGPSRTHRFYLDWLARGYAGEMAYLERQAPLKADLRLLTPQARSVLILAINYHQGPAPSPGDGWRGLVSRYAWGRDYHHVLKEKTAELGAFISAAAGRPVWQRACVDSAPVMERELAARAGLGWVGKNALLIHWRKGSWLLLGELLLDIELEYDAPLPPRQELSLPTSTLPEGPAPLRLRESCGSCRACIDACPTAAIVADKTVDSRRCISYHTIELKGPIPLPFRPLMGEWVFGCDICQEVCPWNRRAPPGREADFSGTLEQARPSLLHLLALDEASFQREFGTTPLARPKRRGLLRNAAIVLGNRLAAATAPSPDRRRAVDALIHALKDREPLIRGAAAWALGRAGLGRALARHLPTDQEPQVRQEIAQALAASPPGNAGPSQLNMPPTALQDTL